MADLVDPGLRLIWAGLKERFDAGHIQWMTPRPTARSQGATRGFVWMTRQPQGRP